MFPTRVYLPANSRRRLAFPFSIGEGTTLKVLRTFTSKPRPEYGPDCLVCATMCSLRGDTVSSTMRRACAVLVLVVWQ